MVIMFYEHHCPARDDGFLINGARDGFIYWEI